MHFLAVLADKQEPKLPFPFFWLPLGFKIVATLLEASPAQPILNKFFQFGKPLKRYRQSVAERDHSGVTVEDAIGDKAGIFSILIGSM